VNRPYDWNVCIRTESPVWQSQQALELLEPSCWMNWHFDEFGVVGDGFVPTIWGRHVMAPERRAAVLASLDAHPDSTWLMVNEGHLREQADMSPSQAVDLALWFIGLARHEGIAMNWCGPNAAINMPALHAGGVTGLDWWREFLRELRQAGIPRPSLHGVHMYHSTDRGMFRRTLETLERDWRWQWMGDGPLVITEMCAENQPLHEQIAVMDAAFEALTVGIAAGPTSKWGVQGVFWFVATGAPGGQGDWPNCVLCEVDPTKRETMRLTPLGRHWKELQARLQ